MSPACFCWHQTGRTLNHWQGRKDDARSWGDVGSGSRWSLGTYLVSMSWDRSDSDRSAGDHHRGGYR